MIKPIDTHYKGYKFRSRLEARWAVAFDVKGYTWSYEDQGFDLGEYGLYLPDFRVKDETEIESSTIFDVWAEVKAGPPTWEEIQKAAGLAKGTGINVHILSGLPGEHVETVVGWMKDYFFAVPFDSQDSMLDVVLEGWQYYDFRKTLTSPWPDITFPQYGTFDKAAEAGKSARFEHGEKPGRKTGR